MQVDEESKSGKNLEFGAYDSDSEDEREKKEQEEGKKSVAVEFTQAENKPGVIMAANCQHSQTMAKIMYGADWVEVAVAKVTEEKEKKTSDALKVYKLPDNAAKDPVYFLMPEKKLSGAEVLNPVISQLFAKITPTQI